MVKEFIDNIVFGSIICGDLCCFDFILIGQFVYSKLE